MLTSFWPNGRTGMRRVVAAAVVTVVATLCGGGTMMTLHAQSNAPTAPAPSVVQPPGAAGTAAEKQALVRNWFFAAATLDFPALVTLSDPGSTDKFKVVMERTPDLATTRGTDEFKALEKRIQELLPQVLTVGDPVAEGDAEAWLPITVDEAKAAQWVELKELVNIYVNEVDAARRDKRPPMKVEDLTKRARESDPSFTANVKANTASLLTQAKLVPKAWIVQDHGAWKVNLTRLERESREAATAASAKK
ncbi:MAG: hypothetical protein ACAI35_07250 [Candidatus Methylacidiphilales bacterium]